MILSLTFPPLSHLFEWPSLLFEGTFWAVNKTSFIYLVAAALTMLLFGLAGRKREGVLIPTGIAHVAESGVNFIENSVVMQTIGSEGRKYIPFLTTLFFFIFFANITGVIPFVQFSANSRMAVPLVLAAVVWLVYNGVGIKHQGLFGYLTNTLFPLGVGKVPVGLSRVWYLVVTIIAFPIELVSVFIVRPFSLAIRLWANMFAGHLLLVLFAVLSATLWDFYYVPSALPFAMLIAITGFEIFVALLQAFIFTVLTAVYIAGAMQHDH